LNGRPIDSPNENKKSSKLRTKEKKPKDPTVSPVGGKATTQESKPKELKNRLDF